MNTHTFVKPPVVEGRHYIRQLRGRTHPRLVAADNGRWYVTKMQNNPVGLRAIVSEWMGYMLMQAVGLPGPPLALIKSPDDTTEAVHLGLEWPVEPASVTVYDWLPDSLLSEQHSHILLGACVFDLWTCNQEWRQAIFHRVANAGRQNVRTILLIDNSHLWGGPTWTFQTSELTGLYVSRYPYRTVTGLETLLPWINKIAETATKTNLTYLRNTIPEQWLVPEDKASLIAVECHLLERANDLKAIVERRALSCPEYFAGWGSQVL